MKRKLAAVVLTVVVAGSLFLIVQPATAVDITIDGPSEVAPSERASFEATVDTRADPVDVDSLNLVITSDTGESVTVTFAPDGTVLDVRSSDVDKEEINVKQFETSLEITPESKRDDVGYGVNGGDTLKYGVQFDAKAFAAGEYGLSMGVNTPDERDRYSSDEEPFEVSSDKKKSL